MSEIRRRWLGNASANVAGGVFTTLFNLALPAMLVRHLDSTDFAVWNLALQVAVYLQIFSAGLQTAVARYIAIGNERKDLTDQIHAVSAAIRIAVICVFLALLVVIILSWGYPLLFNDIPAGKISEFRLCVLWVGISSAFQLFTLLPAGICIGRHRNALWIGCQAVVRAITLVGIYLLTLRDADLTEYSKWYALIGVALIPLSFIVIRNFFPEILVFKEFSQDKFQKMASYCRSVSVWSISTLMVSSLSVAMVGYFDVEKVSAFALAVSLVNVMVSVLSAVMSPLMPNFAALHAVENTKSQLPDFLHKVTLGTVGALIGSLIIVMIFAKPFLRIWVGDGYATSAYSIVVLLAFAAAIRNLCLPYSMLVLSIGAPRDATKAVLLEGFASMVASLCIGSIYGAIGVAVGAIISSTIGVIYNTLVIYPEMDYIGGFRRYALTGILQPLVIMLTMLIVYFAWISL